MAQTHTTQQTSQEIYWKRHKRELRRRKAYKEFFFFLWGRVFHGRNWWVFKSWVWSKPRDWWEFISRDWWVLVNYFHMEVDSDLLSYSYFFSFLFKNTRMDYLKSVLPPQICNFPPFSWVTGMINPSNLSLKNFNNIFLWRVIYNMEDIVMPEKVYNERKTYFAP